MRNKTVLEFLRDKKSLLKLKYLNDMRWILINSTLKSHTLKRYSWDYCDYKYKIYPMAIASHRYTTIPLDKKARKRLKKDIKFLKHVSLSGIKGHKKSLIEKISDREKELKKLNDEFDKEFGKFKTCKLCGVEMTGAALACDKCIDKLRTEIFTGEFCGNCGTPRLRSDGEYCNECGKLW